MNPFAELISMVIGMYVFIVLLRFFLQYFRADFYNPLSQFVIKATDPLIKPIRKLVPGFGGIDVSSLVLAWLVSLVSELVIIILSGSLANASIGLILILPLFKVISGCFNLFMFLIFVRAISSWVAQGGYNPVFAVIGQLTEPLMSKCRRLLPATGGFDLSPMIAIFGLMFVSRLIEYYIYPMIIGLVS
jgi:YggT family protein